MDKDLSWEDIDRMMRQKPHSGERVAPRTKYHIKDMDEDEAMRILFSLGVTDSRVPWRRR